jgi:rhodanese-related sulfurtransferase
MAVQVSTRTVSTRVSGLSSWTRSTGLVVIVILTLFAGGYAVGQGAGRAASESRHALEWQALPLPGGIGAVTPQQVLLADPTTFQLVDVRSREAFALAHATGAVSMPESETVTLMSTLPTDRTLVLYCSCPDEKTSLRSAQTLSSVFHVPNLVVLKGGLDAYTAAGGPVTSAASDSGVEHQGCGCETNAPAYKLYAGNLAAERERLKAEAESGDGE